jgi:hypothetical protein
MPLRGWIYLPDYVESLEKRQRCLQRTSDDNEIHIARNIVTLVYSGEIYCPFQFNILNTEPEISE